MRFVGRTRTRVISIRQQTLDFQQFSARCKDSVDDAAAARFADQLGLSASSLRRLDIGWASATVLRASGTACRGPGAWTFPMVDMTGRVVGVRLRSLDGSKFSVRDSRQGLFVPHGLQNCKLLLFAEGPTDTAAILDLGFDAIGRPNCSGGGKLVRDFVTANRCMQVVVVSDGDEPGRRGAESLACHLLPNCPSVKVLVPPNNIRDIREWKRAGATYGDLLDAIENLRPRRLLVKPLKSIGDNSYG